MAYTPTEWETGDVITADLLNHAEQGIADASPLILETTYDDATHVMTIEGKFSDISDAFSAGRLIYVIDPSGARTEVQSVIDDSLYVYVMMIISSEYSYVKFTAVDENSKPTHDFSEG